MLRNLRRYYGSQIWKEYGFVDAFNPLTGWVSRDVIGIDVGITMLMAENARTEFVWNTFMRNSEANKLQTQTARNVKNAYWDLVYQIDNLKAAQQSLQLSQQSLKDNTRRVEIGTMAPIDIVDAKAEVARNEEAVIVAQAQIEQAQDTLKTLIFDPKTPDFWNSMIQPGSVRSATRMSPVFRVALRGSRMTRTGPRTTPGQQPNPLRCSPSVSATPRRTTTPAPISPPGVERACDTRCTTARTTQL